MAIGIAFMPLFFATPAMAEDPIADATTALNAGNSLVVDLKIDAIEADLLVTSSNQQVISAQQTLSTAESILATESKDALDAKTAYDTKLITQITYTNDGLTATVYNDKGYNDSPPLGAGTIASTQEVANIDFQWGGGSVLGGPSEDVQIKFEGTLTAPETKEYSFYGPADDGFILKINGETVIQDWVDKGGGGSVSQPVLLTAGVANTFEAWYYENGGGAWVQLQWYSGNGWQVVPPTAFDTATVVQTKDPNLLVVLNNANTDLATAQTNKNTAASNLTTAINAYNSAVSAKNVVYADLATAVAAIPTLQQNLASVIEAKRVADAAAAEAARIAEEARIAEIAAQQRAAEQAELDRLAAERAAADRAAAEAEAAANAAAQAEAERLAAEEAARIAEEEKNAATPEPTVSPTEEPTPEPTPSKEPIEEPATSEPEQIPEPEQGTTAEILGELEDIAPEDLTLAQVEELVAAAEETLENSEQGSPEYEQALEALAIAAEADDPEVPSELAAIPLLGDVAGAALEVFNNIGNVGADMAPAVREEAEKTVIATVIAAGAAINAVQSATTAAAAAAVTSSGSSGTSGGSSGGSSSGSAARRKE